jgi:peptidoglycan/LPS O-acetylase OafA/YrhL
MSSLAPQQHSPAYRPDIDGLRAFSVLAVILFHASLPGLRGGFIGVDVFFVISGFLITQLLLVRSGQPFGRWLGEFYLRRARRILPALLLVMAATTVVSVWLFTPAELIGYGRSLALGVVMLANQTARTIGGYFDTPWAFTPLLHLWSVAVEEQFYLAYPLALFVLLRCAPRAAWPALVAVAALASFALCVWASAVHPISNYYLPMTRAWELLLGALVALCPQVRIGNRAVREVLAIAAFAALVVCVTRYDSLLPFPGWYALWPCLAVAALIVTGSHERAAVNRALSVRPLVFVGLISYSLYLWHVPVQVLHRYYLVTEPGPLGIALQLGCIFALSVATWLWIETPLRHRRRLRSSKLFLGVIGSVMAGLFACGFWLWHSDGLPQRFSAEEQRILGATHLPDSAVIACMARVNERVASGDLCRFGQASTPGNVVVLWGDSHALSVLPAVRAIAERSGAEVRFGAVSSCRPLIGALGGFGPKTSQYRCEEFNVAMTDAIRRLNPRLVILAAYWGFPTQDAIALPALTGSPTDSVFSRALQESLRRVADRGRRVCVVRDVPVFKYDVRHAHAMAVRRGIDTGFNDLTGAQAEAQQRALDIEFDALERRGLVHSVKPRRVLCADGHCRTRDGAGEVLYSDTNHLTPAGAHFVAPEIERCFNDELFSDQPMLPRIP